MAELEVGGCDTEHQHHYRSHSDAPITKLTVNLLKTYKKINHVYDSKKRHPEWDDENHHYRVRRGEVWVDRYEIERVVGKGTFCQVVKAYDKEENSWVTIKIIRNNRLFRAQGLIERRLLKMLNRNNRHPENHYIVRYKCHFMFREHLCLVFELLSCNLRDILTKTFYRGASLRVTKQYAQQLCVALQFLSHPSLNIIHCDLKPENILLCNPEMNSPIRIVDFGSSCQVGKQMWHYIQTRFYRSPEVLLGIPYNLSIDMWSLGCVLVELHTGQPLFNGKDQVDQICKIVELLGVPPTNVLERAPRSRERLFKKGPDSTWTLRRLPNGRNDVYRSPGSRSLDDVLGVETGGPWRINKQKPGHTTQDYRKFKSLILQMLHYDPEKRIKPSEALQHAFLS